MRTPLTPALAAEWIKLTSTRMGAVCVAFALGLSVALTALLAVAMAAAAGTCAEPGRRCASDPLRPDVLVSTAGLLGDGTVGPGLAALTILAALMVTVEYRYKTIGTTFMVTPRRSVVLLAKLALAMAIGLGVGVLATAGSTLAFGTLGGLARDGFHPASELALRMYVTVPIVAMLSAAIAVAVGSIARNSVAAVTLVITWPGVVEPLLQALPSVGSDIAQVLPFANARHFVGLDGADAPWGWQLSGVYFLLVTVLLTAIALVRQRRLDVRDS